MSVCSRAVPAGVRCSEDQHDDDCLLHLHGCFQARHKVRPGHMRKKTVPQRIGNRGDETSSESASAYGQIRRPARWPFGFV
jgi:hypothetical protein